MEVKRNVEAIGEGGKQIRSCAQSKGPPHSTVKIGRKIAARGLFRRAMGKQ
jgi:hypothetical protein